MSETDNSDSPISGMQEISISPKPTVSVARKSSAKKSTNSSSALHQKKKVSTATELRQLRTMQGHTSNFMSGFDPSKSRREKVRNSKKVDYAERKAPKKSVPQTIYDDRGYHRKANEDFCDCLDRSCPGCHFPCPKCKSLKCGFDCRQNRKWQVEFIMSENNSIPKRINQYATQTMKK